MEQEKYIIMQVTIIKLYNMAELKSNDKLQIIAACSNIYIQHGTLC